MPSTSDNNSSYYSSSKDDSSSSQEEGFQRDSFIEVGFATNLRDGQEAEEAFYDSRLSDLAERFGTDLERGLTAEAAEERLEEDGYNALPESPPPSPCFVFFKQFEDFMIVILCVVAIIEYAFQEWVEGTVLAAVVLGNVITGFVQEMKALRALAALKSFNVRTAVVLRDGDPTEVDAASLVVGDVVLVDEGATVPADMRLIECAGLRVDEALLTGEVTAIEKIDERIQHAGTARLPVGDRKNMLYMSTFIRAGRGRGVVVQTGQKSEIGKIGVAITKSKPQPTPLQIKLKYLGMVLVAISVFLCLSVSGIGLARASAEPGGVTGEDWKTWIKVGVSLAVAVIPEGLVAVVTVTIAIGVERMAERNAVVRSLPAVETLGSVTVICSDKTGTLTEGRMKVEYLYNGENVFKYTGVGIDPAGEIRKVVKENEELAVAPEWVRRHPETSLYKCAQVMGLCHNAGVVFDPEKDSFVSTGDAMEAALEVAAVKMGLGKVVWRDALDDNAEHTFQMEVPFTSSRQRMTVVYTNVLENGRIEADVLVKGSLERISSLSTSFHSMDGIVPFEEGDSNWKRIFSKAAYFQKQGLRVLALAYRELDVKGLKSLDEDDPETIETDLVFCGIIGMRDPPRAEAKVAVATAHKAGIRVCMITGDHPDTGKAIAKSLGMFTSHKTVNVLTGPEIDGLSDEELIALHPFPTVFARVSPENKQKIVKILQARGDIVAMSGDGVNDAAAIKDANVGVAMGKSGTDLTKEVADIILVDDNLATIIAAIEEGRVTFDNIKKFVHYLLSCNSSEIYVMLFCVIVGLPIPFTPIQILWANLIVDVPPALALGIDSADPDVMNRLPRNPASQIMNKKTGFILFLQGMSIAAVCVGVYTISMYRLPGEEYGVCGTIEEKCRSRGIAFVTLATLHLFQAFLSRSMTETAFRKDLVSNGWLLAGVFISWIVLAVVAYIPGLNDLLDQTALNAHEWAIVIAALFAHVLISEFIKIVVVKWAFKQPCCVENKKEGEDETIPKFFTEV